jgi:hypothetical protein
MSFKVDSGFSYENQPGMPDAEVLALLQRVEREKATRAAALGKSVSSLRDLEVRYRTAFNAVVSLEKQAAMHEFVEEEKKRFDSRMFAGVEKPLSNSDIARALADRSAKTLQFMQRHGIDAGALGKVQADFRKAFAHVFKPEVPVRDGRPIRVMLPGEIPAAVREGKLNPWAERRAPCDSSAWWYNGWLDGFGFTPTLHLNGAAGYIGNGSYLHDGDAGDFDWACVDFETRVGWWYQMPAAGMLEVWVELQPAECLHQLSLYNEWGWSDSYVSQYSYATFRVSGGTSGSSTASYHWWDGYTSGYWALRHLSPGSSYWFHFFSKEAYAKNAWVIPEVGMLNHHYTYANDVSVYSNMDFRYHVKKMYVRVAP